jgi:Cu2+-exporting ATPase
MSSHQHEDAGEHALHDDGHSGGGHEGHAAMFRDRFWVSLLLTLPVVFYSHHLQEWLDYSAPSFPGSSLLAPTLGTVVFFYGGWPFLTGAVEEARGRRPGMMLLIGMAITVAFVASLTASLGLFDVEVWWELCLLITIMLLGHWMEMRAVGQAQGALAALAELLPDETERVNASGDVEQVHVDDLNVGDVVLVRPGGRVPADGVIFHGTGEVDESMITGESRPVPREEGDRVVAPAWSPAAHFGYGSTPSVMTRRWQGSSGWWRRRRSPGLAPRCWPTGPRRCCSTSRWSLAGSPLPPGRCWVSPMPRLPGRSPC